MKCYGCGRDIKEDEEFYIHEDTVYCSDCVKGETVTYYMMDGEVLGQDDEVQVYEDKNEAVTDCKKRLKYLRETLKDIETRDKESHWYKCGFKHYTNLIKIEENLLKILIDSDK